MRRSWRVAGINRTRDMLAASNKSESKTLVELCNECKSSLLELPRLLAEYNHVAKFATLEDYVDYLEDTVERYFKAPLEVALNNVGDQACRDTYQGIGSDILDEGEALLDEINEILQWARNIRRSNLHRSQTEQSDEGDVSVSQTEAAPKPKQETERKVGSLLKKITGWVFEQTWHLVATIIGGLIVAIIIYIFREFGWLERIKEFVYRMVGH